MEISSSRLKFSISLIELERLKPHEEVVQKAVDQLSKEIRQDGMVRDPLIVDREEDVILDGMHRYSSIKQLGCRFAPCCLIDYMDPQVKVSSWFRLFTVREPASTARAVLSAMKLDYIPIRANIDGTYPANAIVLTDEGTCFSLASPPDLLERCRIAIGIEKQVAKEGYRPTYLSETAAMERLKMGQANLIVIVPSFTKETIRRLGSQGILLPHKTTRHIIPSRPLAINAPLSLLMDRKISVEEADARFGDLLMSMKTDLKPPGSLMDGRRYDEELLIFSR